MTDVIVKLNTAILEFLSGEQAGVPEHRLMVAMDAQGFLPIAEASATVELFQKHFLLMHCLYGLQQKLHEAEVAYLHISPLNIVIQPWVAVSGSELTSDTHPDALKHYYGDLTNLEKETDASLGEMLNGFWQGYASVTALSNKDLSSAALHLEVELPVTMSDLRSAYRQKAQSAHPDRGGAQEDFVALSNAFDVLKLHLSATK